MDGITNSVGMNLGKLHERMRDKKPGMLQVHGVAKSWRRLGDLTTTTATILNGERLNAFPLR